MLKCIISNKNCKIKKFLNFHQFPLANFPVENNKLFFFLRKKKYKNKKKLIITKCDKCNYLGLEKRANYKILDNIYSKFYKYSSAMLNDFIPSRDNFFLEYIFKKLNFNKLKNVLEIGCFDGYILYNLKKKFPHLNVVGCEPSVGADIANKFNLNVKKKFFNKKIFNGKKFDVVIVRHTLEHIYNLRKIFEDIKSIMHENSIFAIEVPNINYFLKKGLLEVFSFQHLHYFSSNTFINLSKKYNLQLIDITKTPENLIILLKKNYRFTKLKPSKFKNYVSNFKKTFKKNQIRLNKIISSYAHKDICYWGAGGFSIAAINLYKIPFNKKSMLVDKDPKKHGLSIGDNIIIEKITKNKIKKKKLVVITSYYTQQIYNEIKKLKINIDILKIFPEIKLEKILNK
jgi:2-polyprenyl-3-methyl-5-hydroxy-6-metoxy-1,4-benzoquinol methylase